METGGTKPTLIAVTLLSLKFLSDLTSQSAMCYRLQGSFSTETTFFLAILLVAETRDEQQRRFVRRSG